MRRLLSYSDLDCLVLGIDSLELWTQAKVCGCKDNLMGLIFSCFTVDRDDGLMKIII